MKFFSKAEKQLDKEIERAWYSQAFDIQVNIMDLPKIFADVRAAVLNGSTVFLAVEEAKARYRRN